MRALACLAFLLAAAAAAGETGVTASEVVIGEPSAFSGPSAGLGVEQWRGHAAALAEANDKGGVHGRTIRLVVSDDGYDAENIRRPGPWVRWGRDELPCGCRSRSLE